MMPADTFEPDLESGPASDSAPRDGDAGSGLAVPLLLVCGLGVALRALHIDIPMRYDETVTWVSYASQGWEHVTSNYQNPNNHVFHSLLVAWLTGWLGSDPWIIRLPAFVAGCLLAPAVAWVALEVSGRRAALIAAAIVATSPLLIEYSTNARGYSLLALVVVLAVGVGWRLLAGGHALLWLAWIELGVVGLYTIPTMAIPWFGLTLWMARELRRRAEPERRTGALAPLAVATVVIGVEVIVLYWGIVANEGVGTLLGNRFVAPESTRAFFAAAGAALASILRHWGRGIPLPLALTALLCVGTGFLPHARRREWGSLLASLAFGSTAALLVVRNWGEPRIWQWVAPILAVQAGVGAVAIAARLDRTSALRWAAPAWCGVMAAWLIVADPVRRSLDTGAVPAVLEIYDEIVDDYREGDWVVGDFVAVEPLRYYIGRWAEQNDPPPRGDMERAWVVVDRADSMRTAIVVEQLRRMGAPPLDDSRPVLVTGDISLYLFGRPADVDMSSVSATPAGAIPGPPGSTR